MTTPANPTNDLEKKSLVSDTAFGTFLCILADTLFATMYFFMTALTAHAPNPWTQCFKEGVAAAVAIPIFLFFWKRGKCSPPPLRIFLLLLVAAFFCQFVGVRAHIATVGTIGIVLGLPLIRMFTILVTVFIGAVFLREHLTKLKSVAIATLLVAIVVLIFSKSEGGLGLVTADSALTIFGFPIGTIVLIGLGFALTTGMGYALQTNLLRFVLRKAASESKNAEPVPLMFVVSVVCGFGSLCGAAFLLRDHGLRGFIDVDPVCWQYVICAGVLTTFAFYFKNLAYRYATVAKVATFSVLQIVIGTALGIIFLSEPTNVLLWAGLALCMLGIVLAARTT